MKRILQILLLLGCLIPFSAWGLDGDPVLEGVTAATIDVTQIDMQNTGTLNGLDVIDATTETTIETAIDTLLNLTSIQGQTIDIDGALTVESASLINQDLTTDASPTFTAVNAANVYGGSASGGNFTLNSTSHGTKGKIYFGANSYYNELNSCMFFNTTTPASVTGELYIGNGGRLTIARHSDTAGAGAGIKAYRSGGTETSPSIPLADYLLFNFTAYGWTTGTTYTSGGNFTFLASENWVSGSNVGTLFYIQLRGTGGTTMYDRFYIDGYGNVGINGLTAFGTSAVGNFGIASGTAPTTSPADATQIWSADAGGIAGKAGLHVRSEDGGVQAFHGALGTLNTFTYVKDDLADDGTVVLPDATSGIVIISDNAEGGMWLVQNTGAVVKIAGSTNTAAADTDGSLCVYDSGTGSTVKNRLGATGEIRIVYHYN